LIIKIGHRKNVYYYGSSVYPGLNYEQL